MSFLPPANPFPLFSVAMLSHAVRLRLMREIAALRKTPLDGIRLEGGATVLTELRARLWGPPETPYSGGAFDVVILLGPTFPTEAPKARFLTQIYHPNVDAVGNICVDTLKAGWQPSYGLDRILVTIRCLLIQPNPASALNADAGHLFTDDYARYCAKAQMMTQVHALHDPPPRAPGQPIQPVAEAPDLGPAPQPPQKPAVESDPDLDRTKSATELRADSSRRAKTAVAGRRPKGSGSSSRAPDLATPETSAPQKSR